MRLSMRSARLVVIPALAVLLTAQPGLAANSVASHVTLGISGATFSGKVTSVPRCEGGRTVVLVRVESAGGTTIVTKATTNASGHYSTQIPMQAGNTFYAKVKRKYVGSLECLVDRSKKKVA